MNFSTPCGKTATVVLIIFLLLASCGDGSSESIKSSPCSISCNKETTLVTESNKCFCTNKSGNRHGSYKAWYPDGTTHITRTYKKGKVEGPIYTYTKQGNLHSIHSIQYDIKTYKITFDIYNNDKPLLQGSYINGLPEGKWTYFNFDNGSLNMITEYDNGHFCGTDHRCWDKETSTPVICEKVFESSSCIINEYDKISCTPCELKHDFNLNQSKSLDKSFLHNTQTLREIFLQDSIFIVVINAEEQYSIWPEKLKLPLGWANTGFSGSKSECLNYIKETWTDMRPLSLRRRQAASLSNSRLP